MKRSEIAALAAGSRVSWRCGRSRRFGRVVEQSLHPEAVEQGCVAVSHNNHDVSWIEPRKLRLEDDPKVQPAPRRQRLEIVR